MRTSTSGMNESPGGAQQTDVVAADPCYGRAACRTAPKISPAWRSVSAFGHAGAAARRAISASNSGPTSQGDQPVAEVAVGLDLAGGPRRIAGWPGRSTALAMMVAAASASAAVARQHGDGVGDAEREAAAAALQRPGGDAAHGHVRRQRHRAVQRRRVADCRPRRSVSFSPWREMEGDVAAVVDIGLGQRRGRPASPPAPRRRRRRRPPPSA